MKRTHPSADIHHIRAHRVVHLPVRTLDDVAREHGAEAQHRPDAWPYDESECVEDMLGNRRSRLQRAVAWWCIIIASATFWYFVAQLVRGWLA